MRISDWSSDVCSSDLLGRPDEAVRVLKAAAAADPKSPRPLLTLADLYRQRESWDDEAKYYTAALANRSEEHTSELQSLMRISYAVFCLKKKLYTNTQTTEFLCLYPKQIDHNNA